MDQSRRSDLPPEQFILTELATAESFMVAGEATSDPATRNRCRDNARKALDSLYRFIGHSTDPHVLVDVVQGTTKLELRLSKLGAVEGEQWAARFSSRPGSPEPSGDLLADLSDPEAAPLRNSAWTDPSS